MKFCHSTGPAIAMVLLLTGSAPAVRAAGTETHPRARTQSQQAGRQGWIGVYLETMSSLTRSALGVADNEGVLVGGTVKGSGAESAGLKRGDVLLKVDGESVASDNDVHTALEGKAGKEVRLDLLRATRPLTLTVKAGDRFQDMSGGEEREPGTSPDMEQGQGDDDGDATPRDMTVIMGGSAWLGVEPQDLGKEMGESFGVPDSKGVLIARVLPASPAAKAGLKSGDVLTHLDGTKLENSDDLRHALREIHAMKTIQLTAIRKGQELHLTADVKPRSSWRVGPVNLPDMGQFNWQFREEDRTRLQDEVHKLREELDELKQELKSMEAHRNR